jgi:signal transduction histidine kinase
MSGEWFRAPRQLQFVFVGTMLLLSSTLGWLSWRFLQQDQQLAAQRLAERRETAADLAVAALEKRLSGVEQTLGSILAAGGPPKELEPVDGAVFVQLLPGTFAVWPRNHLIYYPGLPEPAPEPANIFTFADELEFKRRDYAGAIGALREQVASSNEIVRAAALVRTARNYLNSSQFREALQTYAQLSTMGTVPVGGMPAALAGGVGTLAVLERQKDRPRLREAAVALDRELESGRWPILPSTYEYIAQEISRWAPRQDRNPSPGLALAEAIERLWERWGAGLAQTAARESIDTSSGPVLLVWRRSGTALAAFVANGEFLTNQWLLPSSAHWVLTNASGRPVLGNPPAEPGRPAIRLSSLTQLPWTVQVFGASDPGELAAFRSRRRLFLAAIVIMVAAIVTGGWFIGHSVSRELEVARLQSDFVAAVSHEFRTPLTTLCQLSELLKRGRVAGEQDRQRYYEMLHSESDRLRRLIEGLLNFGRLEAGRMELRCEKLDAAALVRQSAAEFERQQASGLSFELEMAGPAPVHVDREALRCVLWNLFENAVKYSPGCATVRVELATRGRRVEIAVKDQGVGIPPGEQRRIFEKFVRGSAARESNIRGTGIGLAMARQIVRAHSGDITVESAPGKGSTFRVLLPVEESA